ncbi:hypothetical protein L6472_13370 [Prevotella sp. E13-17]|uniref:hypothetical protein n=1 Tax=Prevotella sp. E13-17 TaxID=2913616 RepID=UPI001EDBB8B2|nr:hypothetical protein [Prevotella sp. E13-17]UKK50981.1 hypothetical protein L6472_13370 [Prevotella sp. E13-17]
MNYRYIILWAGNSGFGSGFGDEFDNKFNYNTWFVSNYLSLRIRKLHLPTDGPYNMLFCNITKDESLVKEKSVSSLSVNIHVSNEEIEKYLNMSTEVERFEYYLSLLERGYKLASISHDIPIESFLNLHQELRNNNYKNERLFKKKTLKGYGVKVVLEHVLTSYDYRLRMSLFDGKNHFINEGYIYQTYPDDVFFNKNVRHLVIEDGKLIITDFLDHPQFVCELSDLSKGIINSVCVDANTRKYMPNDENREKFERLKW